MIGSITISTRNTLKIIFREILQDNLEEGQAEDVAQRLAQACARNEPDAVDKVTEVLAGIDLTIDGIPAGS